MDSRVLELARKGRDDLFWLCKNVLGYDRVRQKPHQELITWTNRSKKRTKLILMPRGSFKSSVITIGHTIQKIIQNPNIRVLVASETQNKSIKFVSEIRQHIEGNAKFRALYGDWSNRGLCWKSNEFIVKPRTRVKKEPTVMAGSLEKSSLVGLHFDYIVIDDAVSQSTTNTEDAIQKTIDYYKLLLSVLDPGGEVVVIGTIWGAYSLYDWLRDPEGPEYKMVDYFHRAAEDSQGRLTMPEILSREFLDQQKLTQGSYIYSCQYLNKADHTQFAFFKDEDLRYYDDAPDGLIYFLSVDPAISLKARSDYSALVVVGVDYDSNWYILEAVEEKVEPSDLIRLIFELNKKYPLQCLAMENFALEKVLRINLFAEMEKRNEYIAVKTLATNTRVSKEARIRALQPIFEQKKIHIKKSMRSLYRQIITFPHVKNDDLIDALKSMLQVVYPSDMRPIFKEEKQLDKLSQMAYDEIQSFSRRTVKQLEYEDL